MFEPLQIQAPPQSADLLLPMGPAGSQPVRGAPAAAARNSPPGPGRADRQALPDVELAPTCAFDLFWHAAQSGFGIRLQRPDAGGQPPWMLAPRQAELVAGILHVRAPGLSLRLREAAIERALCLRSSGRGGLHHHVALFDGSGRPFLQMGGKQADDAREDCGWRLLIEALLADTGERPA